MLHTYAGDLTVFVHSTKQNVCHLAKAAKFPETWVKAVGMGGGLADTGLWQNKSLSIKWTALMYINLIAPEPQSFGVYTSVYNNH